MHKQLMSSHCNFSKYNYNSRGQLKKHERYIKIVIKNKKQKNQGHSLSLPSYASTWFTQKFA